ITLDGRTISYTIMRSPRAKNIRFEIKPESGLKVVIPRSYNLGELPELLKRRSNWIFKHLDNYCKTQPPAAEKRLKSGDTVPFLGRDLELMVSNNSGGINRIRLEDDRLVVSLGAGSDGLNAALEGWYRMQAARIIRDKAEAVSASLGVRFNRLIIRGQRTRWGSCSQKKNLSFNWKLMLAPKTVIDYVVVHEIAHLKEMNHTKRFWKIVAEHCPRWREHRKWLKEHEAELAVGASLFTSA
ncbi:MAG: M48 family metallopeptidase, partial [Dehalococcoidia bacterium]